MSVSITFEPSGISGVVAQGTYLIDAARRMGAALGAGCTAGKGECPSRVGFGKFGLLSRKHAIEECREVFTVSGRQLERTLVSCNGLVDSPLCPQCPCKTGMRRRFSVADPDGFTHPHFR